MSNILYIAIIVAAVLIGSGLFYFLVKKVGCSIVNVALAVVTAIKDALEGSALESSKFYTILEFIIEALTYFQAIYGDDLTTAGKVDKALIYIKSLAANLSITLSDAEITIITYVLNLGFSVMGALGVGKKTSYYKMFSRMAKYAGIEAVAKEKGLARLTKRMEARKR